MDHNGGDFWLSKTLFIWRKSALNSKIELPSQLGFTCLKRADASHSRNEPFSISYVK